MEMQLQSRRRMFNRQWQQISLHPTDQPIQALRHQLRHIYRPRHLVRHRRVCQYPPNQVHWTRHLRVRLCSQHLMQQPPHPVRRMLRPSPHLQPPTLTPRPRQLDRTVNKIIDLTHAGEAEPGGDTEGTIPIAVTGMEAGEDISSKSPNLYRETTIWTSSC